MAAALAHWNFLARRSSDSTKVQIYNPRIEQHGWQSTHTVIEVVTDDMPFLIDSLGMAMGRLGWTVHLVIHPVIGVCRDDGGRLSRLLEPGDDGGPEGARTEAVIHVEVDRQPESEILESAVEVCTDVIADVRSAVADWRQMQQRLTEARETLRTNKAPVTEVERTEAGAFLDWMADNHFTFLGYREYDLETIDGSTPSGEQMVLRARQGSGLGILCDEGTTCVSRSFSSLPAKVRELARAPTLLVVTKANSRSTVHRPGYLDYIGIKRFDDSGQVVGEYRFLGLYTSAAYNRSPRDIPLCANRCMGLCCERDFRPTVTMRRRWSISWKPFRGTFCSR